MSLKRVLVVGSGAREHAIGWKLLQSPKVSQVIFCPGNDYLRSNESGESILFWKKSESLEALAKKAKEESVDLAIVGPDNEIADGLCDLMREEGTLCFGPSRRAAQIESSKVFAKQVMEAAGVDFAQYQMFTESAEAVAYLDSISPPFVVKADGLAFGKGVTITSSKDEAKEAVFQFLKEHDQILIEEFLEGEELSWMGFCSGKTVSLLESARDYKRLHEDDLGPNTGGMGSYSPVTEYQRPEFFERVSKRIFEPVLEEMDRQGVPFQGLLYAGLMINPKTDRLSVLEFNARWGDPEAQVLLPRMKDDLYSWCEAVARDDLESMPRKVSFHDASACYVVAAAPGYPEHPKKGIQIRGLDERIFMNSNPSFFLAGVGVEQAKPVVSGGRVLGALGVDSTLQEARQKAYQSLSEIEFEGMQFRKDIGGRSVD